MIPPFRIAAGLALLALPLVEIGLLIKVGAILGFWPLLGIILLTAFAGGLVIRSAGLSALSRMLEQMQGNASPMLSLLDQFLVVTAGVLLILPGLIGDGIGALLLIPGMRRLFMKSAASLFTVQRPRAERAEAGDDLRSSQRSGQSGRTARFDPSTEKPQGTRTVTIIEGEYERVDDDRGPAAR